MKCPDSEPIQNFSDEPDATDVIYLDFQKAFDKLSHNRIIIKIKTKYIKKDIERMDIKLSE